MEKDIKEFWVGCECYCREHAVHFLYFPPEKEVPTNEDEEEKLYITVQFDSNMFPFFKRIKMAWKYVMNDLYCPKGGFSDCMDFQTKDLPKIYELLLSNNDPDTGYSLNFVNIIDVREKIWISFYPETIFDEEKLGWIIFFAKLPLFKRIKMAIKYIFKGLDGDAEFELSKEKINRLRQVSKRILDKQNSGK